MDDQEIKRSLAPTDDNAVIDQILRRAKPQPDLGREAALLDRIMRTAERTPRVVPTRGQTHAPRPHSAVSPTVAKSTAPQRPRANRDLWGSMGILAASLVIGIVAGQSSLSDRAVNGFEEATGFTLASASQDAAHTFALAETGDED
jgi:hypothetical protein